MRLFGFVLIFLVFICHQNFFGSTEDIYIRVQHGYVDNEGVKIHYVTLGDGPLIVMLHGFPDFWFTWRNQMEALSENYQVVAIDLRGYNKSDKPKGEENYKMRYLIGDVAAVIQHFPQGKAIVVGHDWGGAIAWQFAMWKPDLVEKLIVLSTPHPNGLIREIRNNSEQEENSQYARDFQKEDAHLKLTAEELAEWVQDEKAKKLYIDAFHHSDFEAMLNYYKASFPKHDSSSNTKKSNSQPKQQRRVQCPTLVIFGLQDKALLSAGWNDTWDWIDNNLTMVSIPDAGHFVQQDASDLVTRSIKMWLNR